MNRTAFTAKDNGYGIISVMDKNGVVVQEFTYSEQEDGTTEIFDSPFDMPVAIVAANADRLRTAEQMVQYASEV